MKKTVLVVILASLTLLVLSACGSQQSADIPETEIAAATETETALEPGAVPDEEAESVDPENNFDLETKTVILNNGMAMPVLGIGTYGLSPEEAENSVYHALLDGYRLIDTANAYMNERGVGRGIERSGVPREEIFVTTKLWPSDYENVDAAIDDTLARLNLEYIDLLLLHQPYGEYMTAYPALEQAVADGRVRAIGLSNFYEEKFDEIMTVATIPPAVLQIETNPLTQQIEMREYLSQYGTVLEAWSPLGGRGHTDTLFNDATIAEIAQAHDKSVVQTILRWHMQMGNVAIPGSSNPDHIQENIEIFDFELTDAEMDFLRGLDTGRGVYEFPDDGGENYISFSPDFNAQE